MSKRLGIANGIATALANGVHENTDLAKRREVTTPDLTTPDLMLGVASYTTSSSYVSARDRDGLVKR